MKKIFIKLILLIIIGLPATVRAENKLPLSIGIYVRAEKSCRDASNADILSYWGSNGSICNQQTACKILQIENMASKYNIQESCKNIREEDSYYEDNITLEIPNEKEFLIDGEKYRYCGTKIELN